jgi:hypothetical protein
VHDRVQSVHNSKADRDLVSDRERATSVPPAPKESRCETATDNDREDDNTDYESRELIIRLIILKTLSVIMSNQY